MGALVLLQFGLQSVIRTRLFAGDLTGRRSAIDEVRALAGATGTSPVGYTDMTVAAWRGEEAPASELIERRMAEADARGIARVKHFANYAAAVLYNGLGRYDAALGAARRTFHHEFLGYTPFVIPELAEAAARTGERALVESALDWMRERTAVTPGDWPLGIEARVRALTADGDDAERCYREVDRAPGSHPRSAPSWPARICSTASGCAARAARVEAREQLRAAHEQFTAMGMEAFAQRARTELLGHRREGPQANARDAGRAHESRGADRTARARWPVEPRDRCASCSSVRAPWSGICARCSRKLGIRSRHDLSHALRGSELSPV